MGLMGLNTTHPNQIEVGCGWMGIHKSSRADALQPSAEHFVGPLNNFLNKLTKYAAILLQPREDLERMHAPNWVNSRGIAG